MSTDKLTDDYKRIETGNYWKLLPRGKGIAPDPLVRYESIHDMGKHVAQLEADGTRTSGAEESSRSHAPADDWDLSLGLDKAIRMAQKGGYWKEGARDLKAVDFDAAELVTRFEADVPRLDIDVHGFRPSVPDFLAGSPYNMMTVIEEPQPHKLIKLNVNIVHSWCFPAPYVLNRGAAVLSCVDFLQHLGYSVEIVASYRARDESTCAGIDTVVKPMDANWDPASVAFALCHPAFGRRLGFRVMESLPGCRAVASGGYGVGSGIDHYDSDYTLVLPAIRGEGPAFKTRESALDAVMTTVMYQLREQEAGRALAA